MIYHRFCDYCGQPFDTQYPHKKFHRDECRLAFNKIVDDNARIVMRAVRESVREIIRARSSLPQPQGDQSHV